MSAISIFLAFFPNCFFFLFSEVAAEKGTIVAKQTKRSVFRHNDISYGRTIYRIDNIQCVRNGNVFS